MENLEVLVQQLRKYPGELPWLEFKKDNYEPETIAADISALANGAAIEERDYAYFLWGIDDKTHEIVGIDKDLQNLKKGKEELDNWLRGVLSKNVDFEYGIAKIEDKNVGVMRIHCAINHPVSFKGCEYIRVGSYTVKLLSYPSLQSRIWGKLNNRKFEDGTACSDLTASEVLNRLDYGVYFELMNISVPVSSDGILHYLKEEGLIHKQDNSLYSITNMGAILFAIKWDMFPSLSRKAIRVVQYEGNSRMEMLKEKTIETGYVRGFEIMMNYIEALIPSRERIFGAVRRRVCAYPISAIREIIANALIHQDFSMHGTGVMIEIFSNRIEVTNPGTPLIDIFRIVDNPPRSRNEKLASIMRRLGMCEELGTGWDKIVLACEHDQLPAPSIEIYEENTKVTIFSEVPFSSCRWMISCGLATCMLVSSMFKKNS